MRIKNITLILLIIILLASFTQGLFTQSVDAKELQKEEKERIKKLKKADKITSTKVTDESLKQYQTERIKRDKIINRDYKKSFKEKVKSIQKTTKSIKYNKIARDIKNFWSGLKISTGLIVFIIAITFFYIVAMWRVFTKAGESGIASIIPFYNVYIMIRIADRPGWWFFLLFIPFLNFIIAILINIDIARNFGYGTGFALGLIFLGFIFWPILAFSGCEYQSYHPPY